MKPLALTMGDPAGIGGELSLKAWLALRDTSQVSSRWTIRSGCSDWPRRWAWRCRSAIVADRRRGARSSSRRCRCCRCGWWLPRSLGSPIRPTPRPLSHRSNRRRSWRWRGGRRRRHQSDQQGGALPGWVRLSGAHRVSGRADRGNRTADHDARQPDAAGCAGDGACIAARFHRHADDGDDRCGCPHHGGRVAAGFRHRVAPAGGRRSQSACRRARRAGHRGNHPGAAGHRCVAGGRDRCFRALAAGHHVHRAARAATMLRSACITIRR